jgi:integrase
MIYQLDDDLIETLHNIEQRFGYVCPAIKESPKNMHNDTLKRHWKKILKNANIDCLRVHDLRHIVGLKLVNAGVSLEIIASVLGHTTTAITKRYSKVRTETAGKAIGKFKELVRQV